MPDHAAHELPRIALVYGQEAAAAHVREAVDGQVEVVYAATAGEFDVGRMRDTRATAALVNLDDGGWLDAIEAPLHAAGVTVVYNDPEISRGLDGWERARWLRHLVAKLRGSRDVDPPRPGAIASPAPAAAEDAGAAAAPADAGLTALPLSPEEIETMTVDLVAEQEPAPAAAAENVAAVNGAPADVMAMDLAIDEAAASASKAGSGRSEIADAEPETHGLPAEPDADFSPEGALDVDTEALSAMIDARLAEPVVSSESSEVWRVAAAAEPSRVDTSAGVEALAPSAAAARDDANVLASLPSLDDWQLVDPETPAAAVEKQEQKAPETAWAETLAGLELVPMETVVPLRINADPIERWLHGSEPVKPVETDGAAQANGGKA
ncbi:MAG: hypothetical protein OJF55_001445 [Rhodanobacteraceae bacterium]|jgi:two-component system chemotaxis response regulator CheB/chemosensory pili system protein ChpB (putative protein-glutamate methylesterase)|nr:MAG: hypothetical protein OJF55_001445 [Rhodanobacteraceae bacterium]